MTRVIEHVVKRSLRAGQPTADAWLDLGSPIAAEITGDV
jgi:2-keto-3-deoxy-L-rhamnonate aldolase RhmA